MNLRAVAAIYKTEMMRTGRTLAQSIVSPVISTALYFVVFGAAIGSRISQIEGIDYGSFIVPGLIMLTLLTQSVMNASFGIYFPRFIGTIYELLSAPVSFFEITLGGDGCELVYDYDTRAERTGVATLLGELSKAGVRIRDLHTDQSSLEEIFVGLVNESQGAP